MTVFGTGSTRVPPLRLARPRAGYVPEGMTVLIVEQNVRISLDIADTACVLDHGVVAHHGPAAAMAADEALIRVKVALTCGTDLKVWKRGYHARMITPPAVFGHELAGIVDPVRHSVRLHDDIGGSSLQIIHGTGHMVHHAVPDQVAEVCQAVDAESGSFAVSLAAYQAAANSPAL